MAVAATLVSHETHNSAAKDDPCSMKLRARLRTPFRALKAPTTRSLSTAGPFTRAADALAGRLTLVMNLGLVIVVLLVPTLFAGVSYLNSVNAQIDFSHQEYAGVDALRPALKVMVGLAADDLIAPDLTDLKAASARHPEIQLDEGIAEIEAALAIYDNQARADAAVATSTVIATIANRSNLVLDPNLDSYYVVDGATTQIPAAFKQQLLSAADFRIVPQKEGAVAQAAEKANVGIQAVLSGALHTVSETLEANIATAVATTDDAALEEDLIPLKSFMAVLSVEADKLEATLQTPSLGDFATASELAGGAIDPTLDALNRLIDTRLGSMEAARNLTTAAIILATALALAWASAVWLSTRHSVQLTNAAVDTLARRDLTAQPLASGRSEFAVIGAGLDRARVQLADAFGKLATASGQVAAAATQLSTSTQNVDGSAQETLDQSQSASKEILLVQGMLSAVSSSGGELTQATHEISHTMSQVNESAQQARADLEGAAALASVLGESSKRISASVSAITAIAAKTRLLALNATIEAARAGDAGSGFAVVAGEVQTLAQQSAEASEAIGRVANDQHAEISRVIESLENAAVAVRAAADAQATVAAAAEQQTTTITQVTDSITGSAEATSRIADQVSRVETVASGTAGTVSQLRLAAEEFDSVAKSLGAQVGAFTVS